MKTGIEIYSEISDRRPSHYDRLENQLDSVSLTDSEAETIIIELSDIWDHIEGNYFTDNNLSEREEINYNLFMAKRGGVI